MSDILSYHQENKIFQSSCDYMIKKNLNMRIFEETNNQVNDGHFGEIGHKVQADYFYKHIKKYL